MNVLGLKYFAWTFYQAYVHILFLRSEQWWDSIVYVKTCILAKYKRAELLYEIFLMGH